MLDLFTYEAFFETEPDTTNNIVPWVRYKHLVRRHVMLTRPNDKEIYSKSAKLREIQVIC